MATKGTQDKIKAVVDCKNLSTTARRAEVAKMILHGASKAEVFQWLNDNFPSKITPNFLQTEWKQALVFIFNTTEATKEEIRATSLARLEYIFSDLEDDSEMQKKDRVSAKLKTIDSINKTAGLYDNSSSVQVEGDSFTISIGDKKIFDK